MEGQEQTTTQPSPDASITEILTQKVGEGVASEEAKSAEDAHDMKRALDELNGQIAQSKDNLAEGKAAEGGEATPAETPGEQPPPKDAPDAGKDAATEPLDPPHHWAAKDQEMFRGLDPSAQEFLISRSKDMEAAHTKRSQEIAPIRGVLNKWGNYLAQSGQTAEGAVEGLIATEYQLRAGTPEVKRRIIQNLVQNYGVEINQQTAAAPSPEEDPMGITKHLQTALTPLAQRVNELSAKVQTNEASAQQMSVSQAQQSLDRFKNEQDANGKVAHPHFDEVIDQMTAQAQAAAAAGKTVEMKELYENACWATPGVRDKILNAQKHQEKQKSQAQAQKLRQASGNLRGTGTHNQAQPSGTVQQDIKLVMDNLASRQA